MTETGVLSFTIQNTGDGILNLTGLPDIVQKTAGDTALFSVSQPAKTALTKNETTTFSLLFNPLEIGTKHLQILIPSNDFNFNLDVYASCTSVTSLYLYSGYPSLAVNSTGIYASFYVNNKSDLMLAKSTNAGNTWNFYTINNNYGGYESSLALDNDIIYVAYPWANVYIAKSTNGGSSWSTNTVGSTVATCPSITVGDTGAVYLCYQNSSTKSLMFSKSLDQSVTWSSPTVIDATSDMGSLNTIATFSNVLFIAYLDKTNSKLIFAKSADNGQNWQITNTGFDCIGTHISLVAKSIDEIFMTFSFNKVLYLAKTVDGGTSWTLKEVDTDYNSNFKSNVRYDAGNLNIMYQASGNAKFTRSMDLGETWSKNMLLYYNAPNKKYYLCFDAYSFFVYQSNLYLIYSDWCETNVTLKFAKSVDGENW